MTSPLQQFKNTNAERWSVLQDIPAWEVESVMGWLRNVFVQFDNTGIYNRENFNYHIIRSIETENRLVIADDLGISTSSWESLRSSLYEQIATNDFTWVMLFLECVVKYVREVDDSMYYYRQVLNSSTILAYLEMSLERGSKWRIVFDKQAEIGLIERVNPDLTNIAKELDVDYLTKAWNEAFAVAPKPDKAIENAQKAIEAVASEKGLTSAKTSVYGNLLGDIKAHPDKYISAAFDAYMLTGKLSYDPQNPIDLNKQFSNWLWTGLDLVQKTNPVRHASTDTKDFVLSPEAGRQATLIATVICQLISAGYFVRKPKEAKTTLANSRDA